MAHDPTEWVHVRRVDGCLVVTPTGPGIEEDTRDALYGVADALRAEPEPRGVVLDLGNVRAIKSLAIGVLVSFQKQVRDSGGRLVLCRLDPDIARAFQLTRVDQLLDIRPGEREAIAALKGGGPSWLSRFFRRGK